jgi:hypothetical protein
MPQHDEPGREGRDRHPRGQDPGDHDPIDLIDYARDQLADVIHPEVTRLIPSNAIELRPRGVVNPEAERLWRSIRFHTDLMSFPRFAEFMDEVCRTDVGSRSTVRSPRGRFETCFLPGTDAYALLKTATEVFLLMNCGICAPVELPPRTVRRRERDTEPVESEETDATGSDAEATDAGASSADDGSDDIFGRGAGGGEFTRTEVQDTLEEFIGSDRNSYLRTILRRLSPTREVIRSSPLCALSIGPGPCLLELIWSYWMEEGMLAQTSNAIALRFQNVRHGNGRDPLAEFELDPLRPLSGFIWGYLQDEPNRLSVLRRTYEYSHHYGLTLYGKAVPQLRPADPRSRFLEAFHDLLRQVAIFYREAADKTVDPDPFPLLVALKEVHLILSEGAHNQYRDLPWTARVEMLLEQWLLARPEMRDFLRGRLMVSYPEDWMGAVDAMKRLQGWTDVSVIHFRDLAVYGERILLSIRYVDWTSIGDPAAAFDWALVWRPEIQGYIHAYRMATGVNLSDEMVDVRRVGDSRYQQPSHHLRQRLLQQQKQKRLPA